MWLITVILFVGAGVNRYSARTEIRKALIMVFYFLFFRAGDN
jgi:hypothetical protein